MCCTAFLIVVVWCRPNCKRQANSMRLVNREFAIAAGTHTVIAENIAGKHGRGLFVRVDTSTVNFIWYAAGRNQPAGTDGARLSSHHNTVPPSRDEHTSSPDNDRSRRPDDQMNDSQSQVRYCDKRNSTTTFSFANNEEQSRKNGWCIHCAGPGCDLRNASKAAPLPPAPHITSAWARAARAVDTRNGKTNRRRNEADPAGCSRTHQSGELRLTSLEEQSGMWSGIFMSQVVIPKNFSVDVIVLILVNVALSTACSQHPGVRCPGPEEPCSFEHPMRRRDTARYRSMVVLAMSFPFPCDSLWISFCNADSFFRLLSTARLLSFGCALKR